MARPIIEVNEELVFGLASIHCTTDEIAKITKVSPDTLERRFAGIIKEGRAQGKASLRRAQWTAAQNGNVVMQIWLGKQLLGQRNNDAYITYAQDEPKSIEDLSQADTSILIEEYKVACQAG